MQPRLIVFDVNETLSDMSPLQQRFADIGMPKAAAGSWFGGMLRDGFALTVTGDKPAFAELAAESLRVLLGDRDEDQVERDVQHLMSGFTSLPVHPDVVEGVHALRDLDLRLATLSNGSSSVAEGLFEQAGIADSFTDLLSVADAPAWKPARSAYEYAVRACGVPAAEAMLVAVHPWDIHGAHEAGLQTGWIDRVGRRYPDFFAAPDVRATSVLDLARTLAAS
ncbi:MAG: haloacid dehalogenase type II [Ornithinimicrobium sp.]|uniref:haloacid dehalogenase type II n=1 Tax=Ornithinimicrobium sp. TaxID=1977084 RepID=UPI003D9BB1D8